MKFGRKPKLGPRELRKIAEWRAKGEPSARIAKIFGVSESTILRTL
ncbi:helix-turn-helix domain-containing protein [Rhizobium leguminosarum]|nr:helix-turn-helix domain-containing protein [Rhizobium leguminosarum]